MIRLIYDNDDGLLVEFTAKFENPEPGIDPWEIDITAAWAIDEDGFIEREFGTREELKQIQSHISVRGRETMKLIATGENPCSERPRYRCEHPGGTCQSTDAQPSR